MTRKIISIVSLILVALLIVSCGFAQKIHNLKLKIPKTVSLLS